MNFRITAEAESAQGDGFHHRIVTADICAIKRKLRLAALNYRHIRRGATDV
ncbi:hypothetical protein D3C87_1979260 [compost metagenome]